MLAARRPGPASGPGSKTSSAFLTLVAGLEEMVAALQARLRGVEVRLGTRVIQVDESPPGYRLTLENGESLRADAVIFAAPAFATADLVSRLDPPLADALRAIPYASTATVSLAYPLADIPRPLDGYGYLIPRAEGRPLLACTWTSTKFPQRAPAGYGLLRAFVGRAGQEQAVNAADDELLRLVRGELRRTLGVTAPPVLCRVFRWPQAMPQYTLGHLDRLAVIEERLAAHPGLFVAGSAYRGVGLPDCIASGEAAAEKAVAFVQSATTSRPVW
jgi:oxygen-dependent protoporphyrinogen oxidase